jgi:hypothetical protein
MHVDGLSVQREVFAWGRPGSSSLPTSPVEGNAQLGTEQTTTALSIYWSRICAPEGSRFAGRVGPGEHFQKSSCGDALS